MADAASGMSDWMMEVHWLAADRCRDHVRCSKEGPASRKQRLGRTRRGVRSGGPDGPSTMSASSAMTGSWSSPATMAAPRWTATGTRLRSRNRVARRRGRRSSTRDDRSDVVARGVVAATTMLLAVSRAGMLGAMLGAIHAGKRRYEPTSNGTRKCEIPARSTRDDTEQHTTSQPSVVRDVEAGSSNLPTPTRKAVVRRRRDANGESNLARRPERTGRRVRGRVE